MSRRPAKSGLGSRLAAAKQHARSVEVAGVRAVILFHPGGRSGSVFA